MTEKSRLIELLNTFNAMELTAFGKFLPSPFFNHRQDVIRLFDYFFQNKAARRKGVFEKEIVSRHIFPNEQYDKKKFGYTTSFLLKAAESFWFMVK